MAATRGVLGCHAQGKQQAPPPPIPIAIYMYIWKRIHVKFLAQRRALFDSNYAQSYFFI